MKNSMTVSVQDASVTISGNWKVKYRVLFVSFTDSGSFNVKIRISSKLQLKIGYKKNRPTVRICNSKCPLIVNGVKVDLNGGYRILKWIYGLFNLEGKISNFLKRKDCEDLMSKLNQQIAKTVQNMNVRLPFDQLLPLPTKPSLELDVGIISQPDFTNFLTLAHKGTVYVNRNYTEPFVNVPLITVDRDESKMLFLWATDYVINSACHALYNVQYFRWNIRQIPFTGYNLSTSNSLLEAYVPKLSKLYPNKMIQITVEANAPPNVTFEQDKVSAFIDGNLASYVVRSEESMKYLFTFGATLKISAKLTSTQTKITWEDVNLSYDMKVLNSTIDEFQLKFAADLLITPFLKQKGLAGITIPELSTFHPLLKRYALGNFSITHGKNILKIGTNVIYT